MLNIFLKKWKNL